MTTDSIELFARRMERRADTLEAKVDRMMVAAFNAIADQVFLSNPVWSSQSVVNWTASIGYRPLRRLINVDRSNVGVRKGKLTGSRSEGDSRNITPHPEIAQMARFQASMAAKEVSSKYVRDSVKTKKGRLRKPKALWLTNNISYTKKLWSGAWPSNPRTLESTLDAGLMATKHFRVFRF